MYEAGGTDQTNTIFGMNKEAQVLLNTKLENILGTARPCRHNLFVVNFCLKKIINYNSNWQTNEMFRKL